MTEEKQFSRQPIRFFTISLSGFLSIFFMLNLLVVNAQEDLQIYTFGSSGAAVTYADTWTLSLNDDGSVTLTDTDGSTRVTLYDSTYLTSHVQSDDSGSAVDILRAMHSFLQVDSRTTFDVARSAEQLLGLRSSTIYPYTPQDSTQSGLFVVLLFSDGLYGFADVLTPAETAEQGQRAALEVLNTFDTVSNLPCTVSAGQVTTVELRVGPGLNRGVNTGMPANQDFTVLGKTTIDGKIWWKLDKSQIAPNSAASELWVADADVSVSSSGCTLVPIVATPAVIPYTEGGSSAGLLNPLCPGTTSAAVVDFAWRTQDLNLVSICIANLKIWQPQASAQQAARLASGECSVQPKSSQLQEYFTGSWALADIATGYYILGLRHKATGQLNEAREAFRTILNSYSCAWAWDPKGWFWSLAQGARDNMP